MDTDEPNISEERNSAQESSAHSETGASSENLARHTDPVVPAPAAAGSDEVFAPEEQERLTPKGSLSQLEMIRFGATRLDGPLIGHAKAPFSFQTIGIAASLAILMAVGGGLIYGRERDSTLLAAKMQENQALASAVNNLKERIDSIDAARAHEETADLRKVLSEIKSNASATRDFGSTIAQLAARVDHIEHDQSAHLDKVGDRLDHDAATRLAEIASRLDKLEKKTVAPVTVAAAPPAAPPKQAPTAPKAETPVSNETTGAIEKPKPRLYGYSIEEVHNGFAIVDSRYGPQTVAPGDIIPGAGRVVRIERRGRDWVVLTSLGVIGSDMEAY